MYNSNPNQRMVTIHRNIPEKGGKQFLTIYTETLAAASKILTGEVAFKLYLFFCANKDQYETYYSPQNFANVYGVAAESGRRAFLQLEEKGFLVYKGNNSYEFFELPQNKPTIAFHVERRMIEQEDGSFIPMTYKELLNELSDQGTEEEIKDYWNNCEVAK